jgi:PEP-CTERM motif
VFSNNPLKTRVLFLVVAVLALAFSGQAGTVSVTFLGADTGVSNGSNFVLPYQLSIDGVTTDAACYDIFDSAYPGQTWTANVWTPGQAATLGQFSSASNASAGYDEIAFLSQQATSSAQDQIDLQEDIWNVFGGDLYPVTTGMQNYLDLLNTPAYAGFALSSVAFLEDANQSEGREQAFVVASSSPGLNTIVGSAPEPGTMVMLAAGIVLGALWMLRRQREE